MNNQPGENNLFKEIVGKNVETVTRRTAIAALLGLMLVGITKRYDGSPEPENSQITLPGLPPMPTGVDVPNNVAMPVLPLEEHVKYGEQGLPLPPEEQKRLMVLAQEILRNLDQNPPAIRVDEALKLLETNNLKDRPEKYVYFPNLDTYFEKDKFLIVAAMYKKGGKDIASEVYKEYPMIGTDHRKVFFPSYFGDMLMEIGNETGVMPQIGWGVRDVNLRALIWARTVDKYKQKNPDKTLADWESMARQEAAPPVVRGFGHVWAADINNWDDPRLKQALIDHGFVGGCTGILGEDLRHWSWTLAKQDSLFKKASCQGGVKIQAAKRKIKKGINKIKKIFKH